MLSEAAQAVLAAALLGWCAAWLLPYLRIPL